MSNNESNISIPINQNNNSTSTENGNSASSRSSIPDIVQVPLLSLTIILAIMYITLILVRPTFRANKLNWFIINLCCTSILLSASMLTMSINRLESNSGESLPCRLQAFLTNMPTCQLMYSHAVVAVSRYLSIVHASKHFFRSTLCLFGCLGLGWLTGILAAVPYLCIDGFSCSSSTRATFLSYYTLFATLIVPDMLVLIFNIRIFLFVHRSSQRVHAEGTGAGVSHARDMHLLKTMIATFIVFVAGWIPLFLTQVFSGSFTISKVADGIFQVLPPLSMLSDVILLIYINQPISLFLIQIILKNHRAHLENTLTVKMKINATVLHKH